MTIGDTSKLDPGLEDSFRTTGLSHLMAVSGANVAMFLGAIGFLLKLLGARRRVTLATLGAALLSFMAITRFEPSVLRAGAMATVTLAGIGFGARREATTALAVAALGLMVQDPFLVYSLGFQLSVIATLGLLVVAPRLTAALRGGSLGVVLGVTLGAQLAVAPLLAMQFHQFSVASLPANVLAVPAVAPATVLGFAAAAVGAVHEPAGVALATAARPALAWISAVAGWFSRVPNASVGLPGGTLGAAVVGMLCVAPLLALRLRRRIRGASVVLAVALLVATTAWGRALEPAQPAGLRLTAIDVGQGDAWLIRTPGGATMLIDGGPDERLILTKLRALVVRTIDLLVLSHPHADHVEGLPAVIAAIPVGRVIEPGLAAEIPALPALHAAAKERGIPLEVVRRGARYALGEAEIEILAPRDPLFTGTDSDLNNNSIVMRIRYGSTCLLMAGEVQEEGQEALLQRPDQLRCPVMTVPHHGSKRMIPGFFATGARYAVISVGRNDFGHPAGETLAALALARLRVLRTDRSGDVTIGIAANGMVEIREEHHAGVAA
jgi:competence protein ComEC